jgi:hypothetical protein
LNLANFSNDGGEDKAELPSDFNNNNKVETTQGLKSLLPQVYRTGLQTLINHHHYHHYFSSIN